MGCMVSSIRAGADSSFERNAPWRSRPASKAQLNLLLKMKGIEFEGDSSNLREIRMMGRTVPMSKITAGMVGSFVTASRRGAYVSDALACWPSLMSEKEKDRHAEGGEQGGKATGQGGKEEAREFAFTGGDLRSAKFGRSSAFGTSFPHRTSIAMT